MPVQNKPIIHARDHEPGGADPLNCLCVPSSPSGPYDVAGIDDLYAYWRLGETATPWADTSGVGTAANLAGTGSGTAVTADVTGALSSGDDGAVEFNYDGTSSSGGIYLRNNGASKPFDIVPMTVAVWAKVKASAITRRGVIIGNSNMSPAGGSHQIGWGLQVIYPARTIRFTRGQPSFPGAERYVETAGGVAAGDWNLITGSYDGATIKLYVNGALIGTAADASGPWGGVPEINIGAGGINAGLDAWFYGTADEAAVWSRALDDEEIDGLYQSGVGGLASGTRVLVSDGEGGATWGQVAPAAVEPGDNGDVLQTLAGAAEWAPFTATSDPADDTVVWMPLTTVTGGVPELVWDANDDLIPTLTPI